MKPAAAVLLLVVAAVMLSYCAFAHRWWHRDDGDDAIGFGLRGVMTCRDGDCDTKSYATYEPPAAGESITTFTWAGRFVLATDLAAAAGIAIVLVAMFLGRARWIDRGFVRGTSVVAAIGALVFVKSAPHVLDAFAMGAPIYLNCAAAVLASLGEGFASDVAQDVARRGARTGSEPPRPS